MDILMTVLKNCCLNSEMRVMMKISPHNWTIGTLRYEDGNGDGNGKEQ